MVNLSDICRDPLHPGTSYLQEFHSMSTEGLDSAYAFPTTAHIDELVLAEMTHCSANSQNYNLKDFELVDEPDT